MDTVSEHSIAEKIGILSAKVSAAHSRVDKLESGIREDLKEINLEVKELAGHMNRAKGWAAALMLLSGVLGALMIKALALVSK